MARRRTTGFNRIGNAGPAGTVMAVPGPTCTTEAVIGTEGTSIMLDRPVPGEIPHRSPAAAAGTTAGPAR
jgi:hypothetical protein